MLKRSPFVRKTPMRTSGLKTLTKAIKPPKGPKPKKCANRACRGPYMPDPRKPFINWCSDDCAVAIGIAKLAKQKAAREKSERAETKRKKEEDTKPAELADRLQKVINRYVLLRDYSEGCISCHMTVYYAGPWNAGHFKSRGASSGLRFHLLNINKQCSQCNLQKGGNVIEYERRLVLKIGADKVEALKNWPRSREYTREYLLRATDIFRRKVDRLEVRLGLKKPKQRVAKASAKTAPTN